MSSISAENPQDLSSHPKKTILLLSSKGGGGHTAAAKTLQSLLGHEYEFKIVKPIDQLRIWGVPSGEQFYNLMLRNGWIRSMNFIVRHLAPTIFRSRVAKLHKIICSAIHTHRPDLVISLIPFVNYPGSEAARIHNIPYLLITTDNDLRNWVLGMDKRKHSQFKVTIGADLPLTRTVLKQKKIPDHMIETIGLPLRPDFIAAKNRMEILEKYNLPENKPILLVMMGGAGNSAAYDYAKKIGRMDLGVHLLVIAGRNQSLKYDLETLSLHPSNSMTVLGYTDKVADLMAISNLIITKPGPGTINEAMAMKLPILIDNTGTSLFWERSNVDLVINYNIGERIRNFNQIKQMLNTFLIDQKVQENIQHSFAQVPSNQFHLRIGEIIREMISLREEAPTQSHTVE